MASALLYLLFLFVAGIFAAVFVQRARPVVTVIISVLIYIPSYFIWFTLQYSGIVTVDSLLKQGFDIDTYQLVGTPLGAFVLFGPPLLPSIIILCWVFLLRRPGDSV